MNVALIVGPSVRFDCTMTSDIPKIQWYEYVTSPPNPILISDGSTLLPGHPNYLRYSLNYTSTHSNLTLLSTVKADGGEYGCTEGTSIGAMYADLVTIDGPPVCTSALPVNGIVLEGIHYTIECTLNFKAKEGIHPLMTWTGPGNFNQLYSKFNGSVLSGVGFNISKNMDFKYFSMLINFTQEGFGGPPGYATNIPTFTYTWDSQILYVQYGPQNVSYSPVQSSYEIGQTLRCNADAVPLPTFKWTNLNTLVDYNSQTLVLTSDMVGALSLRCQVVNSVSSANLLINITVNPITTTPPLTTPTTTTPVPAVSNCPDLTGRWEHTRSATSKAVICISVNVTQNGYVYGLLMNDTERDTYYMEIMGRTRSNIYDETGFIGIWPPPTPGISAFAVECHRCFGVETMLLNALSRSSTDNEFCGSGGQLLDSPQYDFHRVPISYPCSTGQTAWAEMKATSRRAYAAAMM
jgi:hypothetical protein